MKYFSGDLILYPSFSKLFFCDERMLRPSFLCEGVDHLGQQKFQRMSRGAILFRTGGREECSDHGGDEPGKGSISHHSREVGVQSSTQKIFTQCLAKGYVSSQEGSHFEGFALKHSQCYHCLGWECNDPLEWLAGHAKISNQPFFLHHLQKCLCLRAEMMISQPANLEIWGQVLCFFVCTTKEHWGTLELTKNSGGISTRMSTMQTTFLSTNFQGSFPPQYTHVFCPTINMLSCWFVSLKQKGR